MQLKRMSLELNDSHLTNRQLQVRVDELREEITLHSSYASHGDYFSSSCYFIFKSKMFGTFAHLLEKRVMEEAISSIRSRISKKYSCKNKICTFRSGRVNLCECGNTRILIF